MTKKEIMEHFKFSTATPGPWSIDQWALIEVLGVNPLAAYPTDSPKWASEGWDDADEASTVNFCRWPSTAQAVLDTFPGLALRKIDWSDLR